MSIWLRFGDRSIRWDGRLPGGPPVLVPPAWALVERIWESIDAPRSLAVIEPHAWLDETVAEFPEQLASLRLCMVVPDATRSGAFLALIPPLLRRLGDLPFAARTLLVATGTHRPVSAETLRAHFTSHEANAIAWDRWSLIQNSEEQFRTHREIGRTKAGTPVRLHPAYLDADVRIVVGETTYHYFAGYGGASKMIFPGLADPEGAMRNHRLALRVAPTEGPGQSILDGQAAGAPVASGGRAPGAAGNEPADEAGSGSEVRWNEACAPGSVDHNPVAQDLAEAARLAPSAWTVIADPDPPANPDPAKPSAYPLRVLQGRAGSSDPVQEARRSLDARGTVVFTRAPELIIVDAGGGMRDATFLQAHKSLQHAARFVPAGGSILWMARCSEGFGSRDLEMLARAEVSLSHEEVFSHEELSAQEGSAVAPGNGLHAQTICALHRAVAHARVALWSDLPPDQVRRLGIEPLGSESESLQWLARSSARFWGWLPRVERFIPASGWRGGNVS